MVVSTILHPVFVRFVALPRSLLSRLQNKDGDSNWSNFEDQTESYRTLNVPCSTITNSAESAKCTLCATVVRGLWETFY